MIGECEARGSPMLSPEENELLTRTGDSEGRGDATLLDPGVAVAPDRRVRRSAGARPVVGRRSRRVPRRGGRIGLLGEYCPHRRASLFLGATSELRQRLPD